MECSNCLVQLHHFTYMETVAASDKAEVTIHPSFPRIVPFYAYCCCLVGKSFVTPWTIARQAPLSMGFPRQEYWSGLPFASPGNLPDPGIEPTSPALQADSLSLSHQGNPFMPVVPA